VDSANPRCSPCKISWKKSPSRKVTRATTQRYFSDERSGLRSDEGGLICTGLFATFNMMDTDTPRTDDEENRIQCDLSSMRLDDWNAAYHEMKNHAQKLEREVNEMTTKQIELVNHLKLYSANVLSIDTDQRKT